MGGIVVDEYSVWRGNNTDIMHTKYDYAFKLPFEENWDPVNTHSWFHSNWHHSVTISLVYIVAIHVLQKLMKDQKPFYLRNWLVAWNAALAIFSIVACIRFSEEFLFAVTTFRLRTTVCYSIDPTGVAAYWSSLFALSKVAELGDTLFVVLRKRPLIFLHWYHHAAVMIYSWHAGCELTAAGRWFIWMNYTVHSIMYTYYAITATGRRLPKAVSMVVTTLQTTQMFVGVCITAYVYWLKRTGVPCQQSYENLYLCFGIYATFALLFMKFFFDAYIGRPKSRHVKSE